MSTRARTSARRKPTADNENTGLTLSVSTSGQEPIAGSGSLPLAPEHDPTRTPANDGHDFGKIAVDATLAAPTAVPQPKLRVSQPGDVHEQEADAVAGAVLRAPAATTTRPGSGIAEPFPAAEAPASDATQAVPEGGGQPLDTATRAFMEPRFGHDFGHVRVHTDEQAAEAAASYQAQAYTVDNRIIFGAHEYAPGTSEGQRLIAHELAHVVQQSAQTNDGAPSLARRSAAKASGIAGQPVEGVADGIPAHVRIPATPLVAYIDPTVIHRRAAPAKAETRENAEVDPSDALRAVADVLQFGYARLIDGVEPRYRGTVEDLYAARIGTKDGKPISGAERLHLFETAFKRLRPALAAFEKDSEKRTWLANEVTPCVDQLRESLNLAKAQERVAHAILGPDSKLIELPPGGSPHAEAALLHREIPKLLESITVAHELQKSLKIAGKTASLITKSDPHFWFDAPNLLKMIDGYLILTDDEFAENLAHIREQSYFSEVETFAEFVKAVTEIIAGMVAATAKLSGAMANALGETEMADAAFELAEGASGALETIFAGIEIVHGIAVLLDKQSTGEQKAGAARDIALGGGFFGGWLATGSMAVGNSVSTGILYLYFEYRLMGEFQEARKSIMGTWMTMAFDTLRDSGQQIAHDAGELTKAGLLLQDERDAGQRRALASIANENAQSLGAAVDDFLADCKPVGYGPGAAYKPGAYKSLNAQFAPLLLLEGAHTADEATRAAIAVMEKISWCFKHAPDLLNEELGYGTPAKGSPTQKSSN